MRLALSDLLRCRYPTFFRLHPGFEHKDGWFAIIDALSETITALNPQAYVVQAKEKFGTLSFYGFPDLSVFSAQ